MIPPNAEETGFGHDGCHSNVKFPVAVATRGSSSSIAAPNMTHRAGEIEEPLMEPAAPLVSPSKNEDTALATS